MRELLRTLERKHAELLQHERNFLTRNTANPAQTRQLEQIHQRIKSLRIQMDMIDVLMEIDSLHHCTGKNDADETKPTDAVR